MTGPRHCRDPNRDRVQHEPEDEKLRQQNRERIQDNLHLPGFTLPKDVFGINHKHWWKPLVANPHSVGYGYGIFHLKKASRVEVAERLSEVYEAALAELRFKVLSAMSPAKLFGIMCCFRIFTKRSIAALSPSTRTGLPFERTSANAISPMA